VGKVLLRLGGDAFSCRVAVELPGRL